MINLRKLAAVELARLGARIIVAEYAVGVVLPLVLGLMSIRSGLRGSGLFGREAILGVWLVSIAVNYIPLLIYAALIAKAGTAKEEGEPEFAHAKRYRVQQVIILVPFLVAALALLQEGRRCQKLNR